MQRGVLGFEAIFETEGLTISEEEVEAEAKAALGEAADSGEEMQEDRLRQQVFEVIKVRLQPCRGLACLLYVARKLYKSSILSSLYCRRLCRVPILFLMYCREAVQINKDAQMQKN